jgi:hypothetical protein
MIRDITSVDLEEKAMIIRTSQNDPYYLALDGLSLGVLEIKKVISDLKC